MKKPLLAPVLLILLVPIACSDGPTGTPTPTDLRLVGEVPDSARVANVMTPRVQVTDGAGDPVQGLEVRWNVLSGGGELSTGSVTTDGSGEASVDWTLGTDAGENRLEASAAELNPVAVVVAAEAGEPAVMTISPSSLSFDAIGDSTIMSARVEDSYGNLVADATVGWGCDDTLVAQVTPPGWVTGMTAGETLVTATAGAASGQVSVRVAPEPASVDVTPAADTLTGIGDAVRLAASVLDRNDNVIEGASVAWSSLDPDVVSVDAAGTATAVGAGTAVVEASSGGVVGRATVAVHPAAASVLVTPQADTLDALGATLELGAAVQDANGNVLEGAEVTWTSLAPSIATVTADGRVEAVTTGTVEITVSAGGAADTAEVLVRQVVASVETSPTSGMLNALADSLLVTATVKDANGHAIPSVVSWATSDDAVASVAADGWVVSVGAGTTTLTAAVGDSSAVSTVTVEPVVASVTVTPQADTLAAIGQSVSLAAVARDANGYAVDGADVGWSSLAPDVVSVDAAGTATAVGPGTAVIEASSGGVVGRATVAVQPAAATVLVTPQADTLDALGATLELGAEVRDGNGNAIDGAEVTWTSLAPAVAEVTVDGQVEAIATGTAEIAATSGGAADTATVHVEQVVASVEVSPTSAAMTALGDTVPFSVTVKDRNGYLVSGATIVWSSFDTTVATVDVQGRAVAAANGRTAIRASSGDAADESTLDVQQVAAAVAVVPTALGTFDSDSAISVGEGLYQEVEATVFDGNGNPMPEADVRWATSDLATATVDELYGAVRIGGVREGAAVVTATSAAVNESIGVVVPGKIALQVIRGGNWEIYVMHADGTGRTRLTNNTAGDYDPVWSPDGSQIAFRSQRDGNSEIYVMNADGTGQTNVTSNAANDFDPVWSPDGTRIAFVSQRDGNDEIYVMNADGTGQANLTNAASSDYGPVYSPDGSQIAFRNYRDGNWEIYVMNADGTGQTRLTNNTTNDFDPVWSPDGGRIAFRSIRDGNNEIYVMNADGTGQTNLTNNAGDEFQHVWSPDGTRIAFLSQRDGNNEIYVMNADGTGQTNLTNNATSDVLPVWSPDGSQIAFASNRDGNYEIYVMNPDGTGQTNLTNNAENDYPENWRPIPK